MTRMQVRRNTDFTGWPSTEGQTGSQHALEGKTMSLEELFKIAQQIDNAQERVASDKREAFVYMDVTSSEYRKQAAKERRR
ncbi:hypothetical protein P4209_18140 [Pseudomonas aeruginosa]|nr:hypothetical protein [Pseudomonas aeruginosa]